MSDWPASFGGGSDAQAPTEGDGVHANGFGHKTTPEELVSEQPVVESQLSSSMENGHPPSDAAAPPPFVPSVSMDAAAPQDGVVSQNEDVVHNASPPPPPPPFRPASPVTVSADSGGEVRIGEKLVNEGLVKPEQVNAALETQKENGQLIGEILVEQDETSQLNHSDVERLLGSQIPEEALQDSASQEVVSTTNADNKTDKPKKRLGEQLIDLGLIAQDQLEIALQEQKQSSKRELIGDILVSMNFITDSALAEVLAESTGSELSLIHI